MSESIWSKQTPPVPIERSGKLLETLASCEFQPGIDGQPELQEHILRTWGYKRWKRPDGRKRPLRLKRALESCRAMVRELEIVKLRCKEGLSFREIGKRLGISHVAAWKRFHRAIKDARAAEEYRAQCVREIEWKMEQRERLEPVIGHLPIRKRREVLRDMGLIPDTRYSKKRRQTIPAHSCGN